MSIGLSLDSQHFTAWIRRDGAVICRELRPLATVVDDTPAVRRLAFDDALPFVRCGRQLVFYGDGARVAERLFHREVHSLLPEGQLPPADPVARQLIALLIDAMLVDATPGEQACLVVPQLPLADDPSPTRTADFLLHLLRLRGLSACLASAGLAAGIALLAKQELSGLSIVLNADGASASLIHSARELATCHLTDPQSALPGVSLDRARLSDDEHAARATPSEDPLRTMLWALGEEILRTHPLRPLSEARCLCVTGTLAQSLEQQSAIRDGVAAAHWPLDPMPIVFAGPHDQPLARGALLLAELEAERSAVAEPPADLAA